MREQARPKSAGREFRLFPIWSGLFVACLLISNVTSQKIFAVGPFAFPGGEIVFPISYIFGDVLTEVYGYSRARTVIWTGFICQLLAAAIYYVVGILPPASFWHDQEAYDRIFNLVPRIAAASMIAYFCGEFCNSWVLSRMKFAVAGRRGVQQAWRFVASTMVGEAVDTALFALIAFAGVIDLMQLLWMSVSLYLFKVLYEVLFTPLSVRVANWAKTIEGVDTTDDPRQTNYSPFARDRP